MRGLGWVSLLTDAAGDMAYPLIAPLLRSMGAGGAALGVLEAVSEGVGAIVKWRSGALADRVRDRKRLVVAGYALAAIARPLLAVAAAPWQVVAIRSTDRVGKGVRSAPRDAILAGAVSADQRGRAFGFHRMMDNLGAAIGPLLAFAFARVLHWRVRDILAFTLVPGLLGVLVLVFGVRERARATSDPKPEAPPRVAAPLPASLVRYLAALVVFSLGASADSFLLLHLCRLGMDVALVPIAWLSLNLAKAATNMPGGRLSDALGHKRTLVVAWGLYAAVYAAFPLAHSVGAAWALLVVYGAYYGLSEGGEKALVVELSPPEARGRALGAMHALQGGALVVANLAFGAVYEASPNLAFVLSAAVAACGALGLLALVPSRATTARTSG